MLTAPYFTECISEQDLNEMNIEIIRNTLYKVCSCLLGQTYILNEWLFVLRIHNYYFLWAILLSTVTITQAYLEDFAKFCEKLGGPTAEVMREIIAVRALSLAVSRFSKLHAHWCVIVALSRTRTRRRAQ